MATAPTQLLAWEPPHVASVALEEIRKKKKKGIRKRTSSTKTFFLFLFSFFFFRAIPAAYGVPRLGAESELQLPAYTIATATPDR